MKTAIFIYEVSQVESLPALLSRLVEGEQYDIIACGADIEFLLEEKSIPFVSARPFLTLHPYERLLLGRQLSKKIMDAGAFSFFSHNNISLTNLYTPTLFYYLVYFLYYLDIASSLAEKQYGKILFVKIPPVDSLSAGVLAALYSRAVCDAITLAADSRLEVEEWERPGTELKVRNTSFKIKRFFFGLIIGLLNTVTGLQPRKKIRILASDYWKNIETLMHELPDAELVLLDRAEAVKIGLPKIIRNRMRFVHVENFITAGMRKTAREKVAFFKKEWGEKERTYRELEETNFRGRSLAPVLRAAIERFLNDGERVVADIEGTEKMFTTLLPDVVSVRAGTSAQTHFAVLCEVARSLNVPSLEVQHGIFSVGPETETRERAAEYIAEYGPHERELWTTHQYATRSKFLDIGSPRFDEYIPKRDAHKSLEDGTFKILHIAPPWSPGAWNDSWDVYDYFKTMAEAVRDIPNVHVTIKLRGSRVGEGFFREAIRRTFGEIPCTVKMFESLADLLPKADLIVSCHSTALIEALLSHRPVILDASLPVYTPLARNDFEAYRKAHAFEVAETPQELREFVLKYSSSEEARTKLSQNAEKFMHENFLLEDGKSAHRLAIEIHKLAAKTRND